MLLTAQIFI